MKPEKNEDALVDVIDVLLRDGAVLRADVIVSVAGIPLVGLKLSAALAGMDTMTEYGFFREWDREHRGVDDPGYDREQRLQARERDEIAVGSSHVRRDS